MQENFLTKISHEVRTPINAIIGLGFLFQQTRLDDQQRKYLSTIIDSAQNLLQTFQSILDYTTTEDNSLVLQNLPFNLELLLENVAKTIQLRCQEKGLSFHISTAEGVPPILMGDAIRISQILLNIANNAVKFTTKGSVQIFVDMADKDANLVRFSVRDTGIGIAEGYEEKIFEPFMQVDNSHTRTFGGAGLGLATCAQLVKQMQGSISVSPNTLTEQGGSIFTFTLPLPQAEQSALLREGPLQGSKVLVVDHQNLRQQVIANTMRNFGMEVDITDDAEAAIKMIAAADGDDAPYNFTVMAWQTPNVDAIEAADYINKLPLDHPSPLRLLISDYQLEEIEKLAHDAGFFALVQTPADAEAFYAPMVEAYEAQKQMLADEAAAKAQSEQAEEEQGPVRILLVEDNEINQEIAYEVLTSAEYKVDIANNGQEAVDAVEKHKYSLVLMDIQMPVMDGLEATKRIRAQGHKLPIIAMTAHGMADDKETSLSAGMNAHLTKPLEPMALFATITSLLPASIAVAPAKKEPVAKEAAMVRREKLPNSLSGFNLEKGLAAVAGNDALYINLLRKFADRYATINKDIADCLQNNDMETAIRHAHTVRGIAANLGAEALSSAAEGLEKAIKNAPAMTTPLLRTLVVRLTETVNAIHECFGSSQIDVEVQTSVKIEDCLNNAEREHARHVLDQAIVHMEENWGHATDTVAYLLERLHDTPAEQDLLRLKQSIEDFEVQAAQKYSHSVQKLLKTS